MFENTAFRPPQPRTVIGLGGLAGSLCYLMTREHHPRCDTVMRLFRLIVTLAVLLVPDLSYAAAPSAGLSVQVVPAGPLSVSISCGSYCAVPRGAASGTTVGTVTASAPGGFTGTLAFATSGDVCTANNGGSNSGFVLSGSGATRTLQTGSASSGSVCILAQQNGAKGLMVTVGHGTDGDPNEPPGCNLGAHPLIRGRPIVNTKTMLADDGCILRGEINTGSGAFTLSDFQYAVNSLHLNLVEDPGSANGWAQNPASEDAGTDTGVSLANQTGVYLLIPEYNWYGSQISCPDWTNVDGYLKHLASRYGSNTNVIVTVQNEPNYQPCSPPAPTYSTQQIADMESTIWHDVRAIAPNMPIWMWQWSRPDGLPSANDPKSLQSLSTATLGPPDPTVFDGHAYSAWAPFASQAASEGVPIVSSEGAGPYGEPIATLDSAGTAWVTANPPSPPVSWPQD
jgi:hypothetical protein